jgi:spore coat protein CotH
MTLRRLILVVVALAAVPRAVAAQTANDLFDPSRVHDVRLFMNSRDLQQLRDTYQENTYYQADFEWGGVRVRSVAVRSRGYGSRNGTKPGLRIDFNRFVTGQRFLGLESLVLDNLWQDKALIRESVTMALFARLGQPAPREAFARLFINDVYQGLYASVEAIDSAFLSRTFDDPTGYVFEYEWLDEFHGEYLGDSLQPYKKRFKPESRGLEADSSLYSPLHDLFREINRANSATWRQSVERYLDVPGFLTHVAIESFLSELDGILGFWAINNVYLYRPTGSTQHHFVPWDRDHAFQAADSSIMLRANDNVLMRRLLEHPDLRDYYFDVHETVAGVAGESGWLEGEIVRTANLIREAAHADVRKQFTNEDFESSIAFLRTFAAVRSGNVLAEVARLRNTP